VTGAACFETEFSPASVLMIERRSMFAIRPPTPDQARLAPGYEELDIRFERSFI
jgi:hypothetical protein